MEFQPSDNKVLETIIHELSLSALEHKYNKPRLEKINQAILFLEGKSNLKIRSYNLYMGCGQTNDWKKIPFLTGKDVLELNNIGYSGKDTLGNKMTREEYLNTQYPDKSFSLVCTRHDNGDFSEEFIISVYGQKVTMITFLIFIYLWIGSLIFLSLVEDEDLADSEKIKDIPDRDRGIELDRDRP